MSRTPGIVLGLGLGGFIDGIALHQIAQWHNMGSAVLPPRTVEAMRQNMAWDGWFHVATLVLTVVGVYRLLGDARRDVLLPGARAFTGRRAQRKKGRSGERPFSSRPTTGRFRGNGSRNCTCGVS